MKTHTTLGTRVDIHTARYIEEAAEKQSRTVSNLIRLILTDWLDRQRKQGPR
jgi:hypothetical protein